MNPGQTSDGPIPRVLIVDDNSDAAQTTGMWLELNGHHVDVLTEGAGCLPHLESFNPDVLLLDIAMPEISGYELAKQIRSQPRFDRVAIIAVSGYADAEHVQRSMDRVAAISTLSNRSIYTLSSKLLPAKSKNHSWLKAVEHDESHSR